MWDNLTVENARNKYTVQKDEVRTHGGRILEAIL